MTLREFLAAEFWVVYRVVAGERRFFGDSAFGPMWKNIPSYVIVPQGLKLDSLQEVHEYVNSKDLEGYVL